jgi:hypothetical protein
MGLYWYLCTEKHAFGNTVTMHHASQLAATRPFSDFLARYFFEGILLLTSSFRTKMHVGCPFFPTTEAMARPKDPPPITVTYVIEE